MQQESIGQHRQPPAASPWLGLARSIATLAPLTAIAIAASGWSPSFAETGVISSDGPPRHRRPSLDCGGEVRGTAPLTGPGAILLVGEMHGTAQVPELVGRMVCHAADAHNATVILGLELASDNQQAVDAFLMGDGGDESVVALLEAPHFASSTKDGRNSAAMVNLLVSLRVWRAAGGRIIVVCFDAPAGRGTSAAARDEIMASTLLAAHRDRPMSTLVVLSGNIHNRTVPGVPWDASFVPMGAHLRQAFPALVSLDFRSAGGTFWACMGSPNGESTCGIHQGKGTDRGSNPFVELHGERDERGFDGVLYVGRTSASEPAVDVLGTEGRTRLPAV